MMAAVAAVVVILSAVDTATHLLPTAAMHRLPWDLSSARYADQRVSWIACVADASQTLRRTHRAYF